MIVLPDVRRNKGNKACFLLETGFIFGICSWKKLIVVNIKTNI